MDGSSFAVARLACADQIQTPSPISKLKLAQSTQPGYFDGISPLWPVANLLRHAFFVALQLQQYPSQPTGWWKVRSRSKLKLINSVQTRGIAQTSGFTGGVRKNR